MDINYTISIPMENKSFMSLLILFCKILLYKEDITKLY